MLRPNQLLRKSNHDLIKREAPRKWGFSIEETTETHIQDCDTVHLYTTKNEAMKYRVYALFLFLFLFLSVQFATAQQLSLVSEWEVQEPLKVVGSDDGRLFVISGENPESFTQIDLTDPSSPQAYGWFTPSIEPIEMLVDGGLAYIVNNADPMEMAIVDISNPSAPVEVGGAFGNTGIPEFSIRMSKWEDHLYVVSTGNQLTVLNVSDPANVGVVSSLTVPNDLGTSYPAANNDFLYLPSSQGLYVYDCSVPSNLELLLTVPGSFSNCTPDWNNQRLILNTLDPAGVALVGLDDPSQPGLLDVLTMGSTALPPAVMDNLVLVPNFTSLLFQDISQDTFQGLSPVVVPGSVISDLASSDAFALVSNAFTNRVFVYQLDQASTLPSPTGMEVECFPNPTSGLVHVKHPFPGVVRYELLDMGGRQQLSGTLISAEAKLNFPVSPGAYYLRLTGQQHQANIRLIVH